MKPEGAPTSRPSRGRDSRGHRGPEAGAAGAGGSARETPERRRVFLGDILTNSSGGDERRRSATSFYLRHPD